MDSGGMKHKREEDGEEKQQQEQEQEQAAPAPMAASPARNPGLAAAAPPSATGEAWVVAMDDEVNFVRRIKRALGRAKYYEFSSAIRQIHSTGMRDMLDRIKVLLRGQPELKRHFSMFLPTQYKLSLTDDDDDQAGRRRRRTSKKKRQPIACREKTGRPSVID